MTFPDYPRNHVGRFANLLKFKIVRFYASSTKLQNPIFLWPGTDKVPNSSVHGAIFFSRRHDAACVKSDPIFIIGSVTYSKILGIPAIERPGGPTRHKAIPRYLPFDISYGVTLPNAQCCRVAPVPTQKQPPQIRHLAAENSEQFGVRAAWAGKTLQDTG